MPIVLREWMSLRRPISRVRTAQLQTHWLWFAKFLLCRGVSQDSRGIGGTRTKESH